MPRRSRLNTKEGFTLVEVLVASVVLGMVFISSIGAMTIGYRLLENAMTHAQHRLREPQ